MPACVSESIKTGVIVTPAVEQKKKGSKRPRKTNKEIKEEESVEDTGAKTEAGLVVAKAVRQMLKSLPNPYHVSADFLPELNKKVSEIVVEATQRAGSNNRKTLRATDI